LKATSEQGRALLIAEYYINVKQKIKSEQNEILEVNKIFPLYVATSHFESL
jgi:hypothetical protein